MICKVLLDHEMAMILILTEKLACSGDFIRCADSLLTPVNSWLHHD